MLLKFIATILEHCGKLHDIKHSFQILLYLIAFFFRLYFKSLSRLETEKEKYLLAYQVNEEVVNGRFPHNKELAVELAALMAQVKKLSFILLFVLFLA